MAIIEKLLQNKTSQDPFMLHGTSVEAVIELAKTGRLPSGRTYYEECEDRCWKEPGLYFTPVTSKFPNETFLEEIGREACVRSSESYAKGAAFTNYLANALNCQTPQEFNAISGWHFRWDSNREREEFKEKLRKSGIDLSARQMAGFQSHAAKRRGAIVEPNESIMELKPYYAPGPFCIEQEMFVECPEGLDAKYIGGIKLLGPVEDRILKRFLEGKMKYQGFLKHELPAH